MLHLLVAMPLSLDFSENVDSVVVSECPGHLVVVHAEVVLLDSPQLGQTGRVDNFEDPGVLVFPGYVGSVTLL